MERVVVGPEHHRENAAGAFMDGGEETAFIRGLVPVGEQRDAPPVGELEALNIDGVGRRMAAPPSFRRMVHIAAGIGAHVADARDLGAEMLLRGGLHHMPLPHEKRGHGGAGEIDPAAI